MPDKFDYDIDALSRDAAQDFQPEVEAPSWDRIEADLDRAPAAGNNSKKGYWLLLIFLLFMLLPALLNENRHPLNAGKALTTSRTSDIPEAASAIADPSERKTAATAIASIPVSGNRDIPAPDLYPTRKVIATALRANTHAAHIQNSTPTKPSSPSAYSSQTDNNKTTSSSQSFLDTDLTVAETAPHYTTIARFSPAVLPQFFLTSELQKNNSHKSNLLLKEDVLNNSHTDKKTFSSKKKTNLELGILFGSDLSTDQFTHSDNPGVSGGVLVGIGLPKKFTLRTGAIYTRKNYTLNGDQYEYKYSGAYPQYKLDLVSGYCNMIEIPLNIRYSFSKDKVLNPYVSAGLSTYLMLKEDYRYRFTDGTDTIERSRKYTTTREYPFGIVHLSAGITSTITRKIKLSLEPYAKIPVSGIGNGNINLVSVGAYGIISYQLGKK